MTASAEERVKAGMEWLDEHYPDHAQRVDLKILHLGNPEGHPYAQAVEGRCSYFMISQRLDDIDLVPLGFAPMGIFKGVDFPDERALTEEWRRQYQARREADSVTLQGLVGDSSHQTEGSDHSPEVGQEDSPATDFTNAEFLAALREMLGPIGKAISGGDVFLMSMGQPVQVEESFPSALAVATYHRLLDWMDKGQADGAEFDVSLTMLDVADLLAVAIGEAIAHGTEHHSKRHWMRCARNRAAVVHAARLFVDLYEQATKL